MKSTSWVQVASIPGARLMVGHRVGDGAHGNSPHILILRDGERAADMTAAGIANLLTDICCELDATGCAACGSEVFARITTTTTGRWLCEQCMTAENQALERR